MEGDLPAHAQRTRRTRRIDLKESIYSVVLVKEGWLVGWLIEDI